VRSQREQNHIVGNGDFNTLRSSKFLKTKCISAKQRLSLRRSLALVLLVTVIPGLSQTRPRPNDQNQALLLEIRQRFSDDDRLKNVRVDSSDGFIYLRGSVEVLQAARLAMRRVHETALGLGVISQIKVNAPRVSDRVLEGQLVATLRASGFDSVRVRVRRNVVRMDGVIAAENDREAILDSVCRMPGVLGIDDRIRVRASANSLTKESMK
jgi:osmotically-inducible protein OsmY